MMNSIPEGVFYAVFGFNFCSLLYLFVNYRNRPLNIDKICLSYPLLCLPPHSPHVEALLTISFIETQRDIIANNQQYNNRFNYAVSFHFPILSIQCCHSHVSEQLHQDLKVHPAYIPPAQPLRAVPTRSQLLLSLPLHFAGSKTIPDFFWGKASS